jgi:septum formation protein
MNLILASTSPRRIEMMGWLGVSFKAVPSLFDEKSIRDTNPEILTQKLSKAKALSVKHNYPNTIIIGSDSVGEFGGQILEKVADAEEQKRLIKIMRGNEVLVWTSAYLINTESGQEATETVVIRCKMANVEDDLIEKYIESGKGLDKAGGVGLQDFDGAFVEKIDGCYSSALGFPLCKVSEILQKMGISIAVNVKAIVKEKTGKDC